MNVEIGRIRRGAFTVGREHMRRLRMACQTGQTWRQWMRRYPFVHRRRHPGELGAAEVAAFFTRLVVQGKISVSTQNQAPQAPCFSIGRFLGQICHGLLPQRWAGIGCGWLRLVAKWNHNDAARLTRANHACKPDPEGCA